MVRFGALGDMVMLTVAIRHLHARLGQPVDILAAASWTRPLLQGQPGVGDIFLLASRKPPYWLSPAQHRLVRELRARGAGPTWLFDHDNRKVCRLLLLAPAGHRNSGVTTRICQACPARISAIDGCALPSAIRRCSAARICRCAASDAFGELVVTDAQRSEVDAWSQARPWAGRPLILIQAGNKRTMRRGAPSPQ